MTRTNEHLTDEQVKQTHDDLEMLHRPHLWPYKGNHYGVHVKKRDPGGDHSKLRTGVLYTTTEPGKLVLMVLLPSALLPSRERIEFDSPEAVIDAGWVVD